MADILIPIALSSQLDVTGEERIHAARYTVMIRPTYVSPPQPIFLAVGASGKAAKSLDGDIWTTVVIAASNPNFVRVKYLPALNLWVVTAVPDKVYTSPDLSTWTEYQLTDNGGPVSSPADITYGLNTLAVTVNRSYYYGQNPPVATFWQNTLSGSGTAVTSAAASDGTSMVIGDNDGKIWETNNALVWNQRTPPFLSGSDILSIIHDGIQYVATAFSNSGSNASRVAKSTNQGVSWTNVYTTTRDVRGIANNGTASYVLAMNGARIRRSTDLSTWSGDITNPFTFTMNGIAASNSTYVIVANGGELGYSLDDGVTWAMASTNPFGGTAINSVGAGLV